MTEKPVMGWKYRCWDSMAAVPASAEGWATRMGTGEFGEDLCFLQISYGFYSSAAVRPYQLEREVSRRKHLAVHQTSYITKHMGRGPYPGIVGFLFYFQGRE